MATPSHPLELLCACLAAGQRRVPLDERHVAALLHPQADLVGFVRLAGRHLVTPMLADGILGAAQSSALPEAFRLYLDVVHAENERRNQALRLQLIEVADSLNRIGVEPVLLKGAARLVDRLYPNLGWPLMRDLDLLVPRDRVHDAVRQLERIGYAFGRDTRPPGHWHLPPLLPPRGGGVIEIHEDLLSRRSLCLADAVMARSTPAAVDGAWLRLPATVDQLVHRIAHDRLDDPFRYGGVIFLRSSFEIALLARTPADVRGVLDRFASAGLASWAQLALALAGRFFPDHAVLNAERLSGGLRIGLQARALLAVEHLDRDGGARRVVRYARTRAKDIVSSATLRRQFLRSLLSMPYYRRCRSTLTELWLDR